MSERSCSFCKNKGVACERPHTFGEAQARILVDKKGSQSIVLEPIEKCATRLAILERVNASFSEFYLQPQ